MLGDQFLRMGGVEKLGFKSLFLDDFQRPASGSLRLAGVTSKTAGLMTRAGGSVLSKFALPLAAYDLATNVAPESMRRAGLAPKAGHLTGAAMDYAQELYDSGILGPHIYIADAGAKGSIPLGTLSMGETETNLAFLSADGVSMLEGLLSPSADELSVALDKVGGMDRLIASAERVEGMSGYSGMGDLERGRAIYKDLMGDTPISEELTPLHINQILGDKLSPLTGRRFNRIGPWRGKSTYGSVGNREERFLSLNKKKDYSSSETLRREIYENKALTKEVYDFGLNFLSRSASGAGDRQLSSGIGAILRKLSLIHI